MIFGKTKLELKVGVFVFIGLVILCFFILFIGDFKTWGTGYRINIRFNFLNGVKIGAPVRFAGVDEGEVKKIQLFYSPEEKKTKINVICLMRKEARVPLDSKVWVNTLGLLGEKYIEIMPGSDYSKCLADGQAMTGNDPIPMHEVVDLLKNIGDSLNEGIEKINRGEGTMGKLLYDESVYKELEGLIRDIRRNPWKIFWKTKEKPEKK